MGVPRLALWIQRRFPRSYKRFHTGQFSTVIDHVYLDANGILHSCAQRVYNYGSKKRVMDPYSNKSLEEKRTILFEMFFDTIRDITKIVTPKKTLYIAIDGPAPQAKQAQQRQRRFLAAKTRPSHDGSKFDSNSITPGTVFMHELTKYMNYAIRKEIEENEVFGAFQEVYFSPPTVPGEGEHKIMDFIRSREGTKNDTHCIYGPDGDLLMLALATHLPFVSILREDPFEPATYNFYDMSIVRNELANELSYDTTKRTIDDVINDFMLVGFFVGNDFLPKAQMFLYLEDGLQLMLDVYTESSNFGRRNLLTKGGKLNLDGFIKFVKLVSEKEKEYLLDQAEHVSTEDTEVDLTNHTLLKHVNEGYLDYEAYREDYYAKFLETTDPQTLRSLSTTYVRSMAWVLDYYTTGLRSWSWYYPYHYPPLMLDLADCDLSELSLDFELGQPSLPFVQLLFVLPPQSSHLLPSELRYLSTDPSSPLVEKGYYPLDFKMDYEGKTKEYMGIALLPFVSCSDIVKIYRKHSKSMALFERNKVGKLVKFTSGSKKVVYRSAYGVLETSVKRIET